MEKILSQEEMNALLSAKSAAEGGGAKADHGRVTVYNFRRPDRFPKPALHSLHRIHDRFCAGASASLSAYFRTLTEMRVVSMEQVTFGELLKMLPDPTCLSTIGMRPLQGTAILEIGLDVAFPLIDRLLGGAGSPADSSRKMTEIEKNIIHGVMTLITGDLREAWKTTIDVGFQTLSTETQVEFLQLLQPDEVVLVFAIETKIGETRAMAHICLPFSALEPILDVFEKGNAVETKEEIRADRNRVLRRVLQAPVTVSCELTPTMVAVNDLLNLADGDVITLDNKISDNVRLLVEGKPSFSASLAEIEGHKGAGVTRRIPG
jgi:flagellar motor switch protein FliM